MVDFLFQRSGDPRDLHVLTHSFPTRRASDLLLDRAVGSTAAMAASEVGKRENDDFDKIVTLYIAAKAGEVLRGPDIVVAILSKRSEEHTSELQSLMRISYAVVCLKKKKHTTTNIITLNTTCNYKCRVI